MLQVFPGQFEKRARVLAEVVDVEHCLRVQDIWKVDGKMRVDAVTKLGSRDPAGNGNSGSGEDNIVLELGCYKFLYSFLMVAGIDG